MEPKTQLTDKQLQHLRAQVFDIAPDSMYLFSLEDYRILDVNAHMIETLDYTKEELLQMSVFDIHPKEEYEHVYQIFRILQKEGVFKEEHIHHHRRKDGVLLPVQCNILLLTIDNKKVAQCISRDVSTLIKAEQELQERTRNLVTLNKVALDISSGLSLHEILLKISKDAVDAIKADSGGICLYNEEGRYLIKPLLYNFAPEVEESFTAAKVIGEIDPVAKIVITTKQMLEEEDYPRSPYALEGLVKAGLKSVIYIPILAAEKPLGMLGVCSFKRKRKFTTSEIELLQSIARHAGVAIQNAMLFAEVEAAKKSLEDLNKDLGIINNVSVDISRSVELKETSQRIIDAAVKLVNGNRGGIVFYREERPFIYFHGMTDEMREAVERSLPGSISDIVIKTGKPMLLDDYPSHPAAIKFLVDMGVKSLVAAPLSVGGKSFGALIVNSNTPKKFTRHDLSLLQGIAAQSSVAIENARLYEEVKRSYEQEKERSIILQKSFLPSKMPEIYGIEIATYYESATKAALIGGDFYDIIQVDNNLTAFLIGDVSGKGIEAATTTSMVRNIMRSFAYQNPEPSHVLINTNNIIMKQVEPGTFITLIYLLYDHNKGEVTFVNAGHPYPLYCSAGKGFCRELEGSDPAFGFIPDYQYSAIKEEFLQDDIFVLYTDGLTEARRQKEFFGVERVKRIIEENRYQSAIVLAKKLIDGCKIFSEGKLTDDVALLVLKRL